MKVLQQILDKAGLKPIYKFKIRSKSHKDKIHIVELYKDGSLKCDCPKSVYKQGECSHKKQAKEIIEKNAKKCQITQNHHD